MKLRMHAVVYGMAIGWASLFGALPRSGQTQTVVLIVTRRAQMAGNFHRGGFEPSSMTRPAQLVAAPHFAKRSRRRSGRAAPVADFHPLGTVPSRPEYGNQHKQRGAHHERQGILLPGYNEMSTSYPNAASKQKSGRTECDGVRMAGSFDEFAARWPCTARERLRQHIQQEPQRTGHADRMDLRRSRTNPAGCAAARTLQRPPALRRGDVENSLLQIPLAGLSGRVRHGVLVVGYGETDQVGRIKAL